MFLKELIEIGMFEVIIDIYGYVMVIFLSNVENEVLIIGFIFYYDILLDFIGVNVKF